MAPVMPYKTIQCHESAYKSENRFRKKLYRGIPRIHEATSSILTADVTSKFYALYFSIRQVMKILGERRQWVKNREARDDLQPRNWRKSTEKK